MLWHALVPAWPGSSRSTLAAVSLACLLWMPRVEPANFIHTYDVPEKYTQGVLEMPLDVGKHPWVRWYDTDQASLSAFTQQELQPACFACSQKRHMRLHLAAVSPNSNHSMHTSFYQCVIQDHAAVGSSTCVPSDSVCTTCSICTDICFREAFQQPQRSSFSSRCILDATMPPAYWIKACRTQIA